MNDYWKNHYASIGKEFDGALLKQVGKTVNGKEVDELQVSLIVENIVNDLRLSMQDTVVDLCCGNGLITTRLAPFVDQIVGIDFSASLIDSARKYNSSYNIKYIPDDILHLDLKYFLGQKKFLMYEALQHFSEEEFIILLDKLSHADLGSLVFLGSIPNKKKLRVFYNTKNKYIFYMKRESEGEPHIGRWWLIDEIEQIASTRGFQATYLPQLPGLYTAYYRFNFILKKLK